MSTPTAAAEAALERGDYGQCLQLLEPLAAEHPITDPLGAHLRMLMVTAWMGQGQEEKALSTCRLLTRCKDSEMRNRARQLLTILEAPSLQRPASWSMQLPNLAIDPQLGTPPRAARRRRRQVPAAPPPPPTGPTQAAAPGFAVVVLAVLLGLTLLLGGCGRLTADIHLPGPDRIQLGWSTASDGDQLLPWQERLASSLDATGDDWTLHSSDHGHQQFASRTLRGQEAEALWQRSVAVAAAATGLRLPPPQLSLQERNWFLGVQQRLELSLDLSPLQDLPLPALDVRIQPVPSPRAQHGAPNPAERKGNALIWPLEAGRVNQLSMHLWRWNPLGIGSVAVVLLLAISLLLQRLRLTMGFGYPELPS